MITKIMARYRCRSTPQNNADTAVLSPLQKETKEVREVEKNAGHDMAKVGEPCNADHHAKIPTLFMSILCPQLYVHMYLHTNCDYTVVFPL